MLQECSTEDKNVIENKIEKSKSNKKIIMPLHNYNKREINSVNEVKSAYNKMKSLNVLYTNADSLFNKHDSHNFVKLTEIARDNNIHIIELPAHTSHWLQPCDRTVFKPFKDAYNDACQQLMNDYPGTLIFL